MLFNYAVDEKSLGNNLSVPTCPLQFTERKIHKWMKSVVNQRFWLQISEISNQKIPLTDTRNDFFMDGFSRWVAMDKLQQMVAQRTSFFLVYSQVITLLHIKHVVHIFSTCVLASSHEYNPRWYTNFIQVCPIIRWRIGTIGNACFGPHLSLLCMLWKVAYMGITPHHTTIHWMVCFSIGVCWLLYVYDVDGAIQFWPFVRSPWWA